MRSAGLSGQVTNGWLHHVAARVGASSSRTAKIPIPITEINDVFRRVDRAEKEAKAKDPKAKADKQMVLAEFLEALVRTAAKLMNTIKEGKQASQGWEAWRRLREAAHDVRAAARRP